MAGIGFKLKNLLDKNTFSSAIKAYFYSAFISSGPWLCIIICLGALFFFIPYMLPLQEQNLFGATVTYTFAFSLIIVSPFCAILTRFIADSLYVREPEVIPFNLIGGMIIILPVSFIFSSIFYLFFQVDVLYKVIGVLFFTILSLLWFVITFLGTLRDYESIGIAFLIGNIISFGCSAILGKHFQIIGYLFGYTLGIYLITFFFIYRILVEFPIIGKRKIFGFMEYFRPYWKLALIGLIYNTAIWVDKFVFWFSPIGNKIWSTFKVYYPYDTSFFLAYLTIIPTLSIFLLKVETDFYERYADYYRGVINESLTLIQLEQRIQNIKNSLVRSLSDIMKIQVLISGLAIILAPKILLLLGMNISQLSIFRLAIIGSFFHAFFLLVIILLSYFEQYNHVLGLCIAFFVTNAVFTIVTIKLGFAYYGFGYVLSIFIVLLAGIIILYRDITKLNYFTFMRQPIK